MRIAIASGKGGTGKTFVSTNIFRLMEISGYQSALVDCDAEEPNASLFFYFSDKKEFPVKMYIPSIDYDRCQYCGACADICHYHAITCVPLGGYIKLMDDACHACRACEYICKNKAIKPEWKNIGKISVFYHEKQPKIYEGKVRIGQNSPIAVIDETIRRASSFKHDYLILDAPPGCSCPFIHTIFHADYVILVAEPTPFGLSDLKQTVEVLDSLNIGVGIVINKADIGSNEMKQYLNFKKIEIIGEIPFSQKISAEYAEGNLVVDRIPEVKWVFEKILIKIRGYEDSHY